MAALDGQPYGALARSSSDSAEDAELEAAIQASLRGAAGDALMRTPSVQQDLESGMDEAHAARGQALRAELRLVDAEVVGLRHELGRSALLRGPSGVRHVCDADCVVGGCEEEKAEEEGVLCPDCKLFLCHECFGSLNVAHECAVGGRYDRTVAAPAGSGGEPSNAGSLPCPMFPSGCSIGHIALVEIQRALLHPRNRGRDGEYEDIDSPGHSPHKLHLLAQRRTVERRLAAEAEQRAAAGGGSNKARSALARTLTEVRHSRAVELMGVANPTDVSVLLAERRTERAELVQALERFPVADHIPPAAKRTCAQCAGVFHGQIEGAQCSLDRPQCFLCSLCYGAYLMHACSPGGCYELELSDSSESASGQQRKALSARGHVPCPLFRGHRSAGRWISLEHWRWISGSSGSSTDGCGCGNIGTATIQRILLDPRNRSAEFFREMNPVGVIHSLEHTLLLNGSQESQEGQEQQPRGPWSREAELLGRGACPANVWESARGRLAEEDARAAAEQRESMEEQRMLDAEAADGDEAVERARQELVNALDTGGSLRCPKCGVRALKNNACIHMDSCACGSSWCFLCNKLSGDGPGQCPRGQGKGGCDEDAMFLQNCPGWENFALPDLGEDPGMGAQQEFLRRRMAVMCRAVKSETPPHIWQQLRQKHRDLLSDVPTPGRSIDWDALDMAEMPLFGANGGGAGGGEGGDTAAQRVQEHWAAMRGQEVEHGMRNERMVIRTARRAMFPSLVIALVIAILLVDSSVVMRVWPPPSPVTLLNATAICNSEYEFTAYKLRLQDSDAVERCSNVDDDDPDRQRARCVHIAACLFCANETAAVAASATSSSNGLPDGTFCTDSDSTAVAAEAEQVVQAEGVYWLLSTVALLEVWWCFVHFVAAIRAWLQAANLPDAERLVRRQPIERFIVAVPVICVLCYWPAFESAEDMLSHDWFVGVLVAPLSVVVGNAVCAAHAFPCVMAAFQADGPPAWVFGLGALHFMNVCCLGFPYLILAIVFQVENSDYDAGSSGVDSADAASEDLVITTAWTATASFNAIIVLAMCSLGGAVADTLMSAAELGWRATARPGQCGSCHAFLRASMGYLLEYSVGHMLRFYIVGWPVVLTPEELGTEVVTSWLQCLVLVGSIALGITVAVQNFSDRMPRSVAAWLFRFDGIAVVGAIAALCPAFALAVFGRSIDASSSSTTTSSVSSGGGGAAGGPPDLPPPLIYWQGVAMVHCGLLLVVAMWLCVDRDHADGFLRRYQGAQQATANLGARVCCSLLLLAWPVLTTVLLPDSAIDPGGPSEADPLWWIVVGTVSLELGLLGLVYEYATSGRVAPIRWTGVLLMMLVLLVTVGTTVYLRVAAAE